MSGTSGDGVDASLLESDGIDKIKLIKDRYFPYPEVLTREYFLIRDLVKKKEDLYKFKKKIELFDNNITDFNIKICTNLIKDFKIDLIGFHGQTIYHNSKEKLSIQLGSGKKLSKGTNKTVVCNFRLNDLKNGGEGAPLAPIFHRLIIKHSIDKKKINLPVSIINIGGIANITSINNLYKIDSRDIGPGSCLIDLWIRKNSKYKFDKNGIIAKSGKTDKIILNNSLESYFYQNLHKKKSMDIKDFDISFARGLSLSNGAATITEFTAEVLSKEIPNQQIYIAGGGRKNNFLLELLKLKTGNTISLIDTLGYNGDFIESQTFAYLAIRSFLKLPISFPETTGCHTAITGGQIIKT